jgi:hypothetical protein
MGFVPDCMHDAQASFLADLRLLVSVLLDEFVLHYIRWRAAWELLELLNT